MDAIAIAAELIMRGEQMMNSPPDFVSFTQEAAADDLLNNIKDYPHAFVLACIMSRQIKAERAWVVPYRLYERIGDFSIENLSRLSENEVKKLFLKPTPLHRLVNRMSVAFYSGVQRIANQYSGDASRIWLGCPSSAEVVYRFLEFEGVGPKIATMAANILARNFKVPFSDYSSVDISADVHVRRVFARLGLCPSDATIEQVVFRARSLHPIFPGIMDGPCWDIGRNWCRPKELECEACYMDSLCPKVEKN